MITSYLAPGACRVTKGPVTLYSGISSGTLTLTGTWPVNGSKLAIVASAITGHTDCAGTVTVNSEVITFTQAGRKTSTVSLTAKPTIVTASLDCNLIITVLDSGLAPVLAETLAAINTRIEPHQSGHSDAQGVWTTIQDTQIFSDSLLVVDDVVRKDAKDYHIKQVDENPDLSGEVAYYTYLA
jgi:hypothetical protein